MTVPKTPLEKIGRYKVLERVGKGGMGVLYRGFDPVLDREVAIKLMHADFSEDTEQMRPRFYREARAAAKLQHRNIVTIFEFAEESNVPYIVMEFLRGNALGARLNAPPPLTIDDKLNIVAQLCDGLSYAHEQGVVHRDVKPDNIFLLEDGSVKLLDFGIAKLATSTMTRQGDVLGSASYMSPEQVGGSDSVDGRADVFSSGVVLYEMLAGRKPFEGDSPTAVIVKILKDEPTPIESLVTDIPPAVAAVVMQALQKDPANRFQSAAEFGRELQNVRKTLKPALSMASLDETQFASTKVMKALHEDYQRVRGMAPGKDATDASKTAAPADTGSKKWLIPALAGAAVVVAAVAAFTMSSGGETPAAPAQAAATTSAAVVPGTSVPPPATPPAPESPAGIAAPPPAPAPIPAPGAPPAGGPAATARPPAEGKRPAAPPPAAAAAMVSVTLNGNYPFAVIDGGRTISPAATSHSLKLPAGKTVQVQSAANFLAQPVRVEGSATEPFEYVAPGLGSLDVRSVQETCDVLIGTRKLGNPPLVVRDIAAGSYKVDLVCAGETVKTHYATVRANATTVAAIR